MTMYKKNLPDRVRLLVIGGGIHGVGVLHDLVSRGWRDCHLIERHTIGSGTSSKSTKLIHGGLRYLQQIREFSLVSEALHERRTLMRVAPDLVKPLEFIFPILKKGGFNRFTIKTGLTLYDFLAGKDRIARHASLSESEAQNRAPILNTALFNHFFSFFDCQTDDLGLVQRVGASAAALGAGITEHCEVIRVAPCQDGWNVDVKSSDGKIKTISALYVVNAAGSWSHRVLEQSGITPTHHGLNNRGCHIMLPDLGLKSGLFLQSTADGRIFFVLPWQNHTLVGTTEDLYSDNPDSAMVRGVDVDYLLARANHYLKEPLKESSIQATFVGLRWLAIDEGHSLSQTSRAYEIGIHQAQRGFMMTLYGGKLSTYRALSKTIGDRITNHFGEFKASMTEDPNVWIKANHYAPTNIISRFQVPQSEQVG